MRGDGGSGHRVGRSHVRAGSHRAVAAGAQHVPDDWGDLAGLYPATQPQHEEPDYQLRGTVGSEPLTTEGTQLTGRPHTPKGRTSQTETRLN